jgi:hypothetical protein
MPPGGFREVPVLGCKIPGCPGKHEARGYCGKHYQRLTKIGNLADPRATMADADRLWASAERATDGSGCLLWTLTLTNSGYPQVWWNGKSQGAHRIAYMLAVGEIPPGCTVDHVQGNGCRHTECIEPSHLEAITHEEQQRRKTFTPEQRARFAAGGRKGSESRWYGEQDPVRRFWSYGERATDGSGCLLWTLLVNPRTGYGQVSWQGTSRLAHRVAWELANGRPVPDGHDVDHVRARGCRHSHCIEPAHLEAVPLAVNRGRRAHPAVLKPEQAPENLAGPGRRRGNGHSGATKVAPEQIAEWQELLASGLSQHQVAERYKVSQTTVSRAVRNAR